MSDKDAADRLWELWWWTELRHDLLQIRIRVRGCPNYRDQTGVAREVESMLKRLDEVISPAAGGRQ